MRYLDFDVDKNLKETTVHGDESFPMVAYLQRFNLNKRGYVILHWHDELQFSYVTKGSVLFSVNDKEYTVRKGEILFIRSKCLHSARPVGKEEAEYICIDIHPVLICGLPNGRVRTQYVDPFLNKDFIEAIHFDGQAAWHNDIFKNIMRIISLAQSCEYGYELEMQTCACRIWLDIIRNVRSFCAEERGIPPTDRQRMQLLVQYIHDHYMEKVTLNDIALSANISTGECCRIFKRNMRISPIEYLINFRVAQSINLLVDTEKSISEIAQIAGFGSSSYYTERFKRLVHCTPMEYRREYASTYTVDTRNKGKQVEHLAL